MVVFYVLRILSLQNCAILCNALRMALVNYLASATMCKAVKTRAKTLSSISDQVWLLNE
jgi:hypothetical protein